MKNESRSRNVALDEGATDGSYQKMRKNTEVDSYDLTDEARRTLHASYNYGTFAEAPVKRRGDGVISRV